MTRCFCCSQAPVARRGRVAGPTTRPAPLPRALSRPWLLPLAALCLALGLAWPGPATALDLDPRPEGAPLRLPGELFGRDQAVEGRLFVKIGPKKVKYSRVVETAPLSLAAPSPNGPATVQALAEPGGGNDIPLGRFNEIGLDLRDADPANPTLAALTLRAPDGRTFGSDPLECVEHLGQTYLDGLTPDNTAEIATATWADKNALYLARRVLDLPFDDLWRTTQDGPSTFLQRRFDRDALDLGAVDVILRRPAPVQVNLVVALDPADPKARTVLDWYALAKRTFALPDGRTVLRVYVGRYLRERHPGLKWARLKEISLMFFRQGLPEVARDRLAQRLAFIPSGFDPAALARDGLPGPLPTRVREPFAGARRVFVNTTAAASAVGQGGPARAELRLSPMTASQPGGGAAERAYLALSSPRRETPAFLAAADELATSLGAAPDIDRPDGGVPVTPLWSLAPPFDRTPRRAADGFGGLTDEPVYLAGAPGLFTGTGEIRYFRAASGLVVEGTGARLDMAVAAAFAPAAGLNHFFRLDIGRDPGLAGVELLVYAPGQTEPARTYPLLPGQPTPLPGLPARVARAVARFTFTGRDFALPVTRAMLVAAPAGPAATGLYDAALPWPVTSTAVTRAEAGRVSYAPGRSLGPMAWLAAGFELVGDAAAVSVAGGAPAVPDARSGRLMARLPETSGPVELAVAGLGSQPAGQLELVKPVFSGDPAVSWRDVFAAAPLVSLGGADHAPGPVSEATAARLGSADDWLPLGPAALPAKAAMARFFAHPWYGVAALCFETDAPLHLSRFAKPPREAAGGGLGTLSRLLAALALVGGGVIAWRLVGRQRAGAVLSRLTDRPLAWLGATPSPADVRRDTRTFGGLALAGVLVALTVGGAPGRLALALAGLALVPVWRAGAPRTTAALSRRWPGLGAWIAAGPGRTYFCGFALALAIAACFGGLGLPPVAEFFAQAGLYAFLAGLCRLLPTKAPNRADTPQDAAS
ncbi:hypothetical protein [Solidesulfovibrio magneticus]|uniref:Hypothetical membrane protein n=1 Tax=Solidesulfovibrio magneticus (strain ATCC 700980 / DSM 13731 / RS-1) TaxID=573370 RepID=C4XQX2_SOLM1|nr:hypothetical protein [Solidesulfovibrio magneticus]BAH77852.1 hypothetical membrane protein [Solidesulfovibrio magneticus RS-1]